MSGNARRVRQLLEKRGPLPYGHIVQLTRVQADLERAVDELLSSGAVIEIEWRSHGWCVRGLDVPRWWRDAEEVSS